MTTYGARIMRAYRERHPGIERERERHLKMEVMLAYGPWCHCCGETNFWFLTLGHVNNDGHLHRKEKGIGASYGIYRWAKKNDYPDSLRPECWNCNSVKRSYGICPHEDG